MSDKVKTFAPPTLKPVRNKCPPTVSVGSSYRKVTQTTKKEQNAPTSSKNRHSTKVADHDVSFMKPKNSMPNFNAEHRQIAYGKLLRTMLEECLLDEKIEREETEMDIQMTQLADRFVKTVEQLDKTSRRLKEINFVVEQKR